MKLSRCQRKSKGPHGGRCRATAACDLQTTSCPASACDPGGIEPPSAGPGRNRPRRRRAGAAATDRGAAPGEQLRGPGGDAGRHHPRDIRYALQTDRGENVDASEYNFRTSTRLETASGALDRLNKAVFISVGGRRQGGVVYETYLVA